MIGWLFPPDNPFARNQEVTRANLLTYKLLTFASFLLNIIPTIYYTRHIPYDNGHDFKHDHHHRHSTFGQSDAHPTPFTQSYVFVEIYWIVLWVGQIAYIWHLFSKNDAWVRAATTVGPHFIL